MTIEKQAARIMRDLPQIQGNEVVGDAFKVRAAPDVDLGRGTPPR